MNNGTIPKVVSDYLYHLFLTRLQEINDDLGTRDDNWELEWDTIHTVVGYMDWTSQDILKELCYINYQVEKLGLEQE
jgi:hypothetical protein